MKGNTGGYGHTTPESICYYRGFIRLSDNDQKLLKKGDKVKLCTLENAKRSADLLTPCSEMKLGEIVTILRFSQSGSKRLRIKEDALWYEWDWIDRLANGEEQFAKMPEMGETKPASKEDWNTKLEVGDGVIFHDVGDIDEYSGKPPAIMEDMRRHFDGKTVVTVVRIMDRGMFKIVENGLSYAKRWIKEIHHRELPQKGLKKGDKVLICSREEACSDRFLSRSSQKLWGTVVTVLTVDDDGDFHIEEDSYCYSGKWIKSDEKRQTHNAGTPKEYARAMEHARKAVSESLHSPFDIEGCLSGRIDQKERRGTRLKEGIEKLPKKIRLSPYNVLDVFDRPYKTPKRLVGFETLLPFKCGYCVKCGKMLGFKLDDGENDLCGSCMEKCSIRS